MKGLILIFLCLILIKVSSTKSTMESIDRRLDRLSEKVLEDDYKHFNEWM